MGCQFLRSPEMRIASLAKRVQEQQPSAAHHPATSFPEAIQETAPTSKRRGCRFRGPPRRFSPCRLSRDAPYRPAPASLVREDSPRDRTLHDNLSHAMPLPPGDAGFPLKCPRAPLLHDAAQHECQWIFGIGRNSGPEAFPIASRSYQDATWGNSARYARGDLAQSSSGPRGIVKPGPCLGSVRTQNRPDGTQLQADSRCRPPTMFRFPLWRVAAK